MTKTVTAAITLSRAEWASLLFCVVNSTPMLPKELWDAGEDIEAAIEKGLQNPIHKDEQIRVECMRHQLKTQRNDIANLKSQIKKLKSNYRFTNHQFNCLG